MHNDRLNVTYRSKLDSKLYNSMSEKSLPKERIIRADEEDNFSGVNRLANHDDPDVTEIWNNNKWSCSKRNTEYLRK